MREYFAHRGWTNKQKESMVSLSSCSFQLRVVTEFSLSFDFTTKAHIDKSSHRCHFQTHSFKLQQGFCHWKRGRTAVWWFRQNLEGTLERVFFFLIMEVWRGDKNTKCFNFKLNELEGKRDALTAGHLGWGRQCRVSLSACFLGLATPAVSPLLPPPLSRQHRLTGVSAWQGVNQGKTNEKSNTEQAKEANSRLPSWLRSPLTGESNAKVNFAHYGTLKGR